MVWSRVDLGLVLSHDNVCLSGNPLDRVDLLRNMIDGQDPSIGCDPVTDSQLQRHGKSRKDVLYGRENRDRLSSKLL